MILKNLQFEKRQNRSMLMAILNPILFMFLGLAFSAIFIAFMGFQPGAVFAKMISYSFLNIRGLSGSITAGLPLMLCGLSVALAFRMNLNNIGAEGQYAMGAILGGGFVLFGPELPTAMKMILMFLLCALGGMLWALIAGMMKAYFNVNETIVTLMLNYIALLFLDYLTYGPWMAKGQTTAITEAIPKALYLPYFGNTGISIGILVAIAIAVLLFLFLKYTTAGYQIEVIKHSISSAEYAGMNVKRNILLVLGLSGAIAGLAGFVQITGVVHRIQTQMPSNSGYTGIVIAYLSQFNPMAVIIVAILFGGLENSCAAVQLMGVPSQIATMIQGSIMIFVIAGEFFQRNKIILPRNRKRGGEVI